MTWTRAYALNFGHRRTGVRRRRSDSGLEIFLESRDFPKFIEHEHEHKHLRGGNMSTNSLDVDGAEHKELNLNMPPAPGRVWRQF